MVDQLKNKLGFDEAFNYKEEPDFNAALKSTPKYETPWSNTRLWNDLPVQSYSTEGVTNLAHLIFKRVKMEGFVVNDFYHSYSKFLEFVLPKIGEGKVPYVEDIVEGLENGPAALVGLFSGPNVGKQLVVVARE
ncbi:hypothetical protein ACSQ67_020765 [Phaseolus vulgaris]